MCPARLDGVRVIGVDEHCWAHTCHAAGDGDATVIVDLTGIVAGQVVALILWALIIGLVLGLIWQARPVLTATSVIGS